MERLSYLAGVTALLLGAGCQPAVGPTGRVLSAQKVTDAPQEVIALQPEFYDPHLYVAGLQAAKRVPPRADVLAVIVPHHLLASPYITELLAAASGRSVNRLVVVGPNHRDQGTQHVATSAADWRMPSGLVEADQVAVANITTALQIKSHPEVFRNEHSVGAILPFAAHFFPSVPVVPIILHSQTTLAEVEALAQWLAHQPAKTLVVFSADFSHYLSPDQAQLRDVQTQAVIEAGDVAAALTLDNTQHVDSPPTLATALELARLRQLKLSIVHHGTSNDFSLQSGEQVTSYFAILLTR